MKTINKLKNVIIALVICVIYVPINGLKNSIGAMILPENSSLGSLFIVNLVIIWLAFTAWDFFKKITHEAAINQNNTNH